MINRLPLIVLLLQLSIAVVLITSCNIETLEIGPVTLMMPKASGVQVTTQGMLSKITTPSLTNDRGVYTDDAFGNSDVSMRIDIETGIGEMIMKTAE